MEHKPATSNVLTMLVIWRFNVIKKPQDFWLLAAYSDLIDPALPAKLAMLCLLFLAASARARSVSLSQ